MTDGPPPGAEPRPFRYDVRAFRAMADAGILSIDDRVELVDGAILEVPPVGARRATLVDRVARALGSAIGDRARLSVRSPVALAADSETEPDVALLSPDAPAASDAPAAPAALLLVEVADEAVLAYARDVKVPLHARCGVPETWLVDDRARTLTRFADPREGGYATRDLASLADVLEPVALPGLSIGLVGLFED